MIIRSKLLKIMIRVEAIQSCRRKSWAFAKIDQALKLDVSVESNSN